MTEKLKAGNQNILKEDQYFLSHFAPIKNTILFKNLKKFHPKIQDKFLNESFCSISLENFEHIISNPDFSPIVLESQNGNHQFFYEMHHIMEHISYQNQLNIPETRGLFSPKSIVFLELFMTFEHLRNFEISSDSLFQKVYISSNMNLINELQEQHNQKMQQCQEQNDAYNNIQYQSQNIQIELLKNLLNNQNFTSLIITTLEERVANINTIVFKVKQMNLFNGMFQMSQKQLNEHRNQNQGWEDWSHLLFGGGQTSEDKKKVLQEKIKEEEKYFESYLDKKNKIIKIFTNYLNKFCSQYAKNNKQNENDIFTHSFKEQLTLLFDYGNNNSLKCLCLATIKSYLKKDISFDLVWMKLQNSSYLKNQLKSIFQSLQLYLNYFNQVVVAQQSLKEDNQQNQDFNNFCSLLQDTLNNSELILELIKQEYLNDFKQQFALIYPEVLKNLQIQFKNKRKRKSKSKKIRKQYEYEYLQMLDGEFDYHLEETQTEQQKSQDIIRECEIPLYDNSYQNEKICYYDYYFY